MCSWGKQGEIQMKRAVILPVPRASLLGDVMLSNSLFLWQLLHLKACKTTHLYMGQGKRRWHQIFLNVKEMEKTHSA